MSSVLKFSSYLKRIRELCSAHQIFNILRDWGRNCIGDEGNVTADHSEHGGGVACA